MAEYWIEHGEKNEDIAIAAFQAKTGLTVVDRGASCSFTIGGKTFRGQIDGRVAQKKDSINTIEHGKENEDRAIEASEAKEELTVVDGDASCSFTIGGKTFRGQIDGRVAQKKDSINTIEHGKENEDRAIEASEAKQELTVVDGDASCLLTIGGKTVSVKTDGHVAQEEDAIVEAKCPVTNFSQYLQRNENGELILSSSPPWQYYHQIQAYMYALDKQFCYFFDWRNGDQLDIVKVPRNEPFFNDVLKTLETYDGPERQMKKIAHICNNKYY